MASDPSRLYQLLLNTGLQQKDNPLHQVIHDLIGHVISVNKSINTIISGGGSGSGTVGPQGIQGIQGLPGLDGEIIITDDVPISLFALPLPPGFGGTGQNTYVIGDMLYADSAATLARLAMVIGGSILCSTGGPGAPRWLTNVVLGTAGTGVLTVNGKIAAVYTQLDAAESTVNISATLPTITTSTRTGVSFNVASAGSSSNVQQGSVLNFTAGYTGISTCIASGANTNIASAGFVVATKSHANGASAVNIGCNAYVGNGTQNIAVFAGLGDQDGATFSSGISGCFVGTNSTTGSNLIDLYSNVTSAFRVTDAGVVTSKSSMAAGGNLQAGATSFVTWNGLSAMKSPADGQINFVKQSTIIGFGIDFTTDGVCAFRNRAQNADAAITHSAYTHSGAEIDKTYQIYAPVTGGTVTMSAGQSRAIINPLAGLALLTVTLPSSPVDGQVAGFSFTQIITGLTVNAPGGATVIAPPTTAAVDSNFRFLYQASSTSWFPCS